MMKWLLLAVVVVAVLWWLGRARRSGSGSAGASAHANRQPPSQAASPGAAAAPQPMVACAHCGVLLPQAEAYAEEGQAAPASESRFYCGEPHRRAGPRRA